MFSGLRWKEVARHTGWGLFGIVTSMLVAWSGAQGAFQRYGEHLAQQKHAANEKTTIVYMPTEQAPDTKKPEEDDGEKDAKEEQQEQAEEDAKEEQQEQAEEDI